MSQTTFLSSEVLGKQELSIGTNCDSLGIVEHEFLHALGIWHEQSRADRDDYVNIIWDQIEAGKEHSFNRYDDTVASALGVPYDYNSVMHYGKTAFSVGTEPTIVTKIPEFLDVIGQRMDFSSSDLQKLNKLYNCTTFSAFLDSCSFDQPNICGMILGEDSNSKWVRVKSVAGGPNTDYTTLGQCNDAGYFMHLSTINANPGDKSYLESRHFYPNRGLQCLQFYLYNSGATDDQLNVWVREYDSENPNGVLRLIQSISGGRRNSWEIHHVTLDVSKKFRVVFEGVKGIEVSRGGLSVDDINLSETQCPQFSWHIQNFTSLLDTTPVDSKIYSPVYLSPDGYSYQIGLYINGVSSSPDNMALYLYLTSGPYDSQLTWPCPWRQATMALMDQNPNILQRMDNQRMFTTDPERTTTDSQGNVQYFWDDPRKVGSLVVDSDGNSYYRGPGLGFSSYITHLRLKSRDFIKGNDVIFLLSLQDISGFLAPQSMVRAAACDDGCQQKSPSPVTSTATVVVGAFVGAVMLLLLVGSVLYGLRKLRKKGQNDSEGGVEPETING